MSVIIAENTIEKKQGYKLKERLKLLDKMKFDSVDFITITFENNLQYVVFRGKKFHSLLVNLKKNYGVHSYFWVLEFQSRGVAHYHILLLRNSKKKIGFIDRKKKYRKYVGFTNIKKVYSKIYSYLLKYLNKEKERKKIVLYKKHPVLKNKNIKKIYRYRRYGFGGKIKDMKEYKAIMESLIEKKIKNKGIIYNKRERQLIKNNTKIEYKFLIEYHRDIGLEIKEFYMTVYKKKHDTLYFYKWEKQYEYIYYLESFPDIEFCYNLMILILEEEN